MRSIQLTKLLTRLICAYSFLLGLVWLRNHWSYFSYPFDLEYSDGDLLGAAKRMAQGLPIYGSWKKGEIFLNYGPLYYSLLSVLDRFHLDAASLGRLFNGIFFFLASLLAGATAYFGTRESSSKENSALAAAFTVIFFWSNWIQFDFSMSLRPDAFLLFGTGLLCFFLTRPKPAPYRVGVTLAHLPFIKQTALGLVAGVFSNFIFKNRAQGMKLAVSFLGVALFWILTFETQNDFHFLRSIFVEPSRVFSGELMDLGHLSYQLGIFYEKVLWLIPLAFLGIFSVAKDKKKALSPLLWVFVFEFASMLYLGRNRGGGLSYFWNHWIFVSLWAGVGVIEFSNWARRFHERRGREVAVSVVLLLSFWCFGRALFKGASPDLRGARALNISHEERIKKWVNLQPRALWWTSRPSMALLRNGVLPSHESCTFEMAFRDRPEKELELFRNQLRAGKYGYVFSGGAPCWNDRVFAKVSNCFRKVDQSDAVLAGDHRVTAEIFQFVGCPTAQDSNY